ncbi:MAG: glycosyltransferase [Mycobacteriaceae bacterium]|nr:glycosyltransferase [Mycobacteriaceae bacterium]
MKFVLAAHGTRGDIEPVAAVGLELLRRGHQVRMAVPPNLVGFVESAGLTAVPYGPDSQQQLDAFSDVWQAWRPQNPITLIRTSSEYFSLGWAEMSTTLTALAAGADLLLTTAGYQDVAANVAEYHDIPLAALHCFPFRPNGHLLPTVPAPVTRAATATVEWIHWRMTKRAQVAQRRELGLPHASGSAARRMIERGSLEIQAYDELFFPGLAAEWSDRRPFIGALTLGLATHADAEITSWINAGPPPLYFGFGSMPIESPADTVAMIKAVCAQLGQRALICLGANQISPLPQSTQVKIVSAVNHAAVFPLCRALVHHGGAGTTAAGLRAGVPTLILSVAAEQPIWAAQVRRLKVGHARRFSGTTQKSLLTDLRRILAPQYAIRARDLASKMTAPSDSVATAAQLLEQAAHTTAAAAGTQASESW